MRPAGRNRHATATFAATTGSDPSAESARALAEFLGAQREVLVLTGAGVSTASGIPDYRDPEGRWKRGQPIQHSRFMTDPYARQHYWARSFIGWPAFAGAQPNAAHRALARLESAGYIRHLVTQNVDGLHQRAGSRRVLDLHGRLDFVDCQECGLRISRHSLQERLSGLNPELAEAADITAPDGDAVISATVIRKFVVPVCEGCGGTLKPNVVFFGGNIPRPRQRRALDKLTAADALLIVGSSLMVFSGYRIVREAIARAMPIAALNLGRTRTDEELTLKVDADCATVLPRLAREMLT